MTPAAYIALARDLIILIALGLLIWLLISFGSDRVKVADMKMVQKQIADNAKIESDWRKAQTDANVQRDADLAKVAAGIAAQRAPIILRNPSRACPVPAVPATASSPPATAGGTDTGSRGDRDIRSDINRFELKVETAIADCRAALEGWPK